MILATVSNSSHNADSISARFGTIFILARKTSDSSHCYDLYSPVISVELTELADRVVANNDSVVEIQLDLFIQQLHVPAWHESLLMSMSDALLRALQRWITRHEYPMKSQCYVSLQAVEPLPLPLTRCLEGLKKIFPSLHFFHGRVT